MPKAGRKAVPRTNVRIPKPVMDRVDEIVQDSGLYLNRQQFVESAIREKAEKTRLLTEREELDFGSGAKVKALSRGDKVSDDLLVSIKDAFMAHAVLKKVKEERLPADHLDLEQLEKRVREYVEKRAGGKKLGKRRLDRLVKEILSYHLGILEGLSL
jgi:Arc/MetJ-type ribon-helix-helix transcriptional regulator